MEFGWEQEHDDFRHEVRAFVGEHRTPELVAELEAPGAEGGGRGPEAQQFRKALNEAGYTTMAWPEEYGGQGKGAFYTYILVEELGYWGLPFDTMSIMSVGATIMSFGTEQQKQEWLPKIQSGEMTFALGYTEPNAGTDLASLQTRAIRDGDDYVLNGQKIYTSSAHVSTHVWLAARTDPDAPKHRGISMFVIPMTTPGITVRPLWTMGDGRTNETFWEDVRIPADSLVGEENRGWYMAANALDLERVVIGPVAPSRRRWDRLIDYLKAEREDLLDDPYVRTQVAETRMDVEITRALAVTNAAIIANGGVPTMQASAGKVWVSEAAHRMTSLGMDLFGGFGGIQGESEEDTVAEGRFEAEFRSTPVTRFGGGTNDIQRRIIATRGLGLPRG